MPYAASEASRSLEVIEVPTVPWWILALLAAVVGISIIGGVIVYEEERKKMQKMK